MSPRWIRQHARAGPSVDDDDLVTTIDTSLDSAVDTAIEVSLEPTDPGSTLDDMDTIEIPALSTVTGGMNWQDLPTSNVEDRRSKAGKRREQQWWDRTLAPTTLPAPRAPGI